MKKLMSIIILFLGFVCFTNSYSLSVGNFSNLSKRIDRLGNEKIEILREKLEKKEGIKENFIKNNNLFISDFKNGNLKEIGKEIFYKNFNELENYFHENFEQIIKGFENENSCNYLENIKIDIGEYSDIYRKLGIYLKLNKYKVFSIIGCELYSNSSFKVSAEIKTQSAKYRVFNISKGLSMFNGKVLAPGENLSIYDEVFKAKNYMNGYALVWDAKNGKVGEKLVSGGGLCGVSTVFYQVSLIPDTFDIIKRYSHMNFYYTYYNKTGLDATIYGNGQRALKDLIVKNNGNSKVLISTWSKEIGKEFWYGVNYYNLHGFKEKQIKLGNFYQSGRKKCVINTIISIDGTEEKIKSCYFGVF